MYQLKINNLCEQEFLNQYWQKKPLLIKQGFTDFQDPIAVSYTHLTLPTTPYV